MTEQANILRRRMALRQVRIARGAAYRHAAPRARIQWYVKYRSRTNRIVRRIVFAVLAVLIVVCAVLWYRGITATILSAVREVMRARTTEAVNEAIYETLSDPVRYDDLITVVHGGDGDIRAMTANAYEINRIARDCAYLSQKKLQSVSEAGVTIPLGAFFGIDALVGVGPGVTISILPVAVVTGRFTSSFDSAGINQTRHSIYLEVETELSVVLPGRTDSFTVTTQVLIAESVLVGDVPQTYLHANLFGSGYVVRGAQ